MALTPAEKQRRYCQRHLGRHGNKATLQLTIDTHARAALRRIARHHGYTVTKLIEITAVRLERNILGRLSEAKRKAYLNEKAR
jgi:hypothetical protein